MDPGSVGNLRQYQNTALKFAWWAGRSLLLSLAGLQLVDINICIIYNYTVYIKVDNLVGPNNSTFVKVNDSQHWEGTK